MTHQSYLTYWPILLIFAFILCAFCAASETGIFSLNRYRLRHRAKTNSLARRIYNLLAQPDKILSVILICNVFSMALASTVTYEVAHEYWGDLGAVLSPFVLTIFLLIFGELTPKTLAALRPELTAQMAAWPLQILLWILYPVVWATSKFSIWLLRLFGVRPSGKSYDPLNIEELRTVLNETNALISPFHQDMLLGILDLEKMRVEHIMVPRNEVIGINLEEPMRVKDALLNLKHTLLPIYRGNLDNVLGIIHARNIPSLLLDPHFNENRLLSSAEEPYFIPESTSLYKLLLNFQRDKKRIGLVVDEYGDILGLVTLEDILEEIIGDFSKKEADQRIINSDEQGGGFLVDGSLSVREINKLQNWNLPTEGPNTLSGLIIETLEFIPSPKTCVKINDYAIEIMQMKDNTVKLARVLPPGTKLPETKLDSLETL